MEVQIYTSDPDAVDPTLVAEVLAAAGFYVRNVNVNDGERSWSEES